MTCSHENLLFIGAEGGGGGNLSGFILDPVRIMLSSEDDILISVIDFCQDLSRN